MLVIDTAVRPSSVHGTGLFCQEALPEGRLIWVLHKNFDPMFSAEEWLLLPVPAKEYLRTYMYWSLKHKKYVACLDNSRFMNHSSSPNTKSVFFSNIESLPAHIKNTLSYEQWLQIDIIEGFVVAAKNIEANEEILCDYHNDFPDLGGAGTDKFLID